MEFVRACVHLPLYTWDLYLVLHQHNTHRRAAFCPTLLCVILERLIAPLEGCIQRMVGFKRLLDSLCVCVHCQVLVDDGRISQAARLWLWQTQVGQMEWCAPRWPALSIVCTQFAAVDLNCWFCPRWKTLDFSGNTNVSLYLSNIWSVWTCHNCFILLTAMKAYFVYMSIIP